MTVSAAVTKVWSQWFISQSANLDLELLTFFVLHQLNWSFTKLWFVKLVLKIADQFLSHHGYQGFHWSCKVLKFLCGLYAVKSAEEGRRCCRSRCEVLSADLKSDRHLQAA